MASLHELLHLVARWVHLIAGIMWIGNSMLFNWLDRNLEPVPERPGAVGENWMIHSGGFYQVVKLIPAPGALPKTLHWFKWQNGITWLSGISLLVLVYHLGGAAIMVDAQVAAITGGRAIALGIGAIVASWVLYDVIWRSPLGKHPTLATLASALEVFLLSVLLFHHLSGRAAYMHVGVMIGTIMTGNVWFVIMPAQRELVAATSEWRKQRPERGYQAKQRSVHNNYLTFPLLFIMISNHFPTTFGNAHDAAVLLVLAAGSMGIRHLMNIRFTYPGWLTWALALFGATCVAMLVFFAHPAGFSPARGPSIAGHVGWSDVEPIVARRCVPCHARHPTNPAVTTAPNGVTFEERDTVYRWRERIRLRVVELRNMPLGNATGITDDERARIGAWIDQGARD